MRILDGEVPQDRAWRTLVILEPGSEPGPIWQFGQRVAHANRGEAVAAVIMPEAQMENALLRARESLQRARDEASAEGPTHALLIETQDVGKAIRALIEKADIDLLLADASAQWHGLDKVACAIGMLRGGTYVDFSEDENPPSPANGELPQQGEGRAIRNILVPTSAGPNSAHALRFVLPLTPETRVTALYVAAAHMGSRAEALGRSRLEQLLRFVDAGDRIESKLIVAENVTEGIIAEARQDYDLVLIGASRESRVDKALFGDVVGSVVRESQRPVIVVREPNDQLGSIARQLSWGLRHVIPRLDRANRSEVYVRVHRSARPSADYFVLIGLSATIAAFGLLLNSPAVVIGAMLVAPLMSPMVGVGLAIVLGDTRFIRLSLGAVLRGLLLAVFLGALVGLLRHDSPLTAEVLARTQPSLLDLAVALFAGFAGAFALTNSDAAAALPGVAIAASLVPPLAAAGIAFSSRNPYEGMGALLLFTANFVAIVFAAVLVFLLRGFRPAESNKAQRAVQTRSVQVEIVMLIVVAAVLALFTYRLAQNQQLLNTIEQTTSRALVDVADATLTRLDIQNVGGETEPLALNIVAESEHVVPFSMVEQLQEQIAADLQPFLPEGKPVQIVLTVIRVTRLDPVSPPTPTETLIAPTAAGQNPTETMTPMASTSPTETPTPSVTPAETETPLPTETLIAAPTMTQAPPEATASPAVPRAQVNAPFGVDMREAPEADALVVAVVPNGAVVELLPEEQVVAGIRWQKIVYAGQEGWVISGLLTPFDP